MTIMLCILYILKKKIDQIDCIDNFCFELSVLTSKSNIIIAHVVFAFEDKEALKINLMIYLYLKNF